MRTLCLIFFGIWAPSVMAAVPFDHSQVRRSVFKIYVDSQQYQPRRPWKQTRTERSSGSGFYIGNGRIMTNAHVVANAKYISLLRDGESEPTQAVVEFVAHDCDLAVVRPVNSDYLRGVTTLPFGDLPTVQSPVATVGYARGGEQVSITQGVVSRIEFRRYVHSGFHRHILLQVDSAINPGNSGGPVFQGDKVVGVAFQANSAAENTGYVIPNLVIQRFIKDISDGKYDGHPEDGMTIMTEVTRADAVRSYYQLRPDQSGVMVIHVATKSPSENIVQPGDILISVDGNRIGSDGKISFGVERIDLNVVNDLKQIGDKVDYELVRAGKSMHVDVPVRIFVPTYLPANDYYRMPKFFVFGGYLFSGLSRNFLSSWGSKWYDKAPLVLRYAHYFGNYEPQFKDLEQIIVYAGRLPHQSNSQSSGNEFGIVRAVNGQHVTSIRQMHELVTTATTDLLRIDFFYDPEPLVISRARALAADAEVNVQYGVDPAQSIDSVLDGSVTLQDLQ